MNLSYQWLDGTSSLVSGTVVGRENEHLWSELGLGGSVLLGRQLTLYGEASGDTAIKDFGHTYDMKGVLGLRMAF